MNVAPVMIAQVVLLDEDSHWYVRPEAIVLPTKERLKGRLGQTEVSFAATVPAVGDPEHGTPGSIVIE